ncbi:hypothetical protein N658DRAFT_568918 [Parathielavia hyrcaniae]|uniref:Uncharacterized protein n=1 Tax=Parathielavia hyrcaniae TaxID=113614 RepID=A0AAN6SY52_9PEZI|nr:hypothetical protein N658DRAFT_568918 [Parathielavia hyrcaniae]
MERTNRGYDSRPPPTSSRGPPKKKARREWPPKQGDDAEWSGPATTRSCSLGRSRDDDEDARDTKPPHQLGDYVIQPAFKIRGNSLGAAAAPKSEAGSSFAAPKSEASCDSDPDPTSLPGLERTFLAVAQSTFAEIRNLESVIAAYSPTHPARRGVAKIKEGVARLNDVYHSMGAEIQGFANELDNAYAREDALRRDLEDGRTVNFKLTCAKKDLAEQVRELKAAADGAETELRRLRREVRDAEAKAYKLDASYREAQTERAKVVAEKLSLEAIIRKREAEAKDAAAEASRMKFLVVDLRKEIEGLKSDNARFQNLAQQRELEADNARAEIAKLQAQSQQAQQAASPITPVSSLEPLGAAPLPSGQPVQPRQPEHLLPPPPESSIPTPGSPVPYIKQEAPDPTTEAIEATLSTLRCPIDGVEQPPDVVQRIHRLGAGAADLLGKLLQINRSVPYNDVLASFLGHLGAAPEAPSIPVTQPTGCWQFDDPWTPDRHGPQPATIHPTLEAQFAHLCLLFPFPATTKPRPDSSNIDDDDIPTFHILTSLLTSLTRADYSTSPRAGWAFLQTITTTTTTTAHEKDASSTARAAILRLMLSELCRVLEQTFSDAVPGLRRQQQQQQQQNCLNPARGHHHAPTPLAGVPTGGDVKERLAAGCGLGGTGDEGKEMGLLHCGEGTNYFLVLDFGSRRLRLVDCRLARWEPHAAGPRKMDLIVARGGAAGRCEGEGEEELFRLKAAPKDVAAFWVRYAMADV